jgi:hypothetical protein
LQKTWLCAAKFQFGLTHRTVRWCTGQCPVRQAGPRELAALGIRRWRTAKNHRTVRWCTRLSGESSAANSSLSGKASGRRGYNSPDCPVSQRSPAPTVGRKICGRRVAGGTRLSGVPTGPELQRSTVLDLEGNRAPDRLQLLSGGAPDCPVRRSTEGKDGLPSLPPTAPSCLGAIKGTPRRMEESPKHSLSILRLPHSVFAHLIDCVSDLSSVRVVNSLCYVSS